MEVKATKLISVAIRKLGENDSAIILFPAHAHGLQSSKMRRKLVPQNKLLVQEEAARENWITSQIPAYNSKGTSRTAS